MSIRTAAITAIAAFLILAAVFWSVSFAMNHTSSGEGTITAAVVANKVANVVTTAVACQPSPSVGASGLSWTQDGASIVATTTGGTMQLSVVSGSSKFPIAQPIYTDCTLPTTVTAVGAQ